MNPLVSMLAQAWHEVGHLGEIPSNRVPANRDQAYAIQAALVESVGQPIHAWKVGMAPQTNEILCSPIVASRVYPEGAPLEFARFKPCAVELELAVRFSRSFPLRDKPYSDAEVLGSLAEMSAAVEIVTSRLEGWPDRDPWLKLADFNNNGALVLGKAIPFNPNLERMDIPAHFHLAGQPVFEGSASNPAGDPLILLTGMVNQCAQRGMPVLENHWITTGSYTGCRTVDHGGVLTGTLGALPAISLSL
jgi:2-keto-4-pentenoate hydratase